MIVVGTLDDGALATVISTTSLLVALLSIHNNPADACLATDPRRAAPLDREPDEPEYVGPTLGQHGGEPQPRARHLTVDAPLIAVERQVQRLAERSAGRGATLRLEGADNSQTWAALMARISHEIRTPLNAVIGFSDLMQAELFGPLGHVRYGEYVNHIRDSGKALLKSAEDTLAMTSLLATSETAASRASVSLAAAAEEAWSFIEAEAAGKGVSLDLVAAGDIELLVDRRALRQILINLLSEALYRAKPESRIALVASVDTELTQIEILVPDVTATAPLVGATLGLSIARALLELCGSGLIEIKCSDAGWRVATVLDRAVQADFFAAHATPHGGRRQGA